MKNNKLIQIKHKEKDQIPEIFHLHQEDLQSLKIHNKEEEKEFFLTRII
jgi:hypothetical protein